MTSTGEVQNQSGRTDTRVAWFGPLGSPPDTLSANVCLNVLPGQPDTSSSTLGFGRKLMGAHRHANPHRNCVPCHGNTSIRL